MQIELAKPLLLDTRPIFERGQTPCKAIDTAVESLIPGQPLVIITPFEPVPLYAKFSKLGFSHQAQKLDAKSWQVEFRKVN